MRLLSTAALEALRLALGNNSQRITQGITVLPLIWDIEGADEPELFCPLCFAGFASGHATVGAVEAYYLDLCDRADARLGEPDGCRAFVEWYDAADREEAFLDLIDEIQLELAGRVERSAA